MMIAAVSLVVIVALAVIGAIWYFLGESTDRLNTSRSA